jgi:hypothetical protein
MTPQRSEPVARRVLPLTGADWQRALLGLAAPFRSVAGLVRGRAKLAALPVRVAMFLLSTLIWYLVARIATYGFFWGSGDPDTSWGGPTLAGAWAVHALIALGIVIVSMWTLAPLHQVYQRLTS